MRWNIGIVVAVVVSLFAAIMLPVAANAKPSMSDEKVSVSGAVGSLSNTRAPSITGSPRIGSKLTAQPGSWSGASSPSFAYAWQRCPKVVSQSQSQSFETCAPVAGQSTNSYVVSKDDSVSYLRVVVTAKAGTVSAAASSPTVTPLVVAPTNSTVPRVSGTVAVGQVLSASDGTWTGSPTLSRTWMRCTATVAAATSTIPSTCAVVSPAVTDTSYTLSGADAGKFMAIKLTATNVGGSLSFISASTVAVTAPPASTVAPTVTGTPTVGQTLTAVPGTWTGFPTPTFTYLWWRCTTPIDASASSLPDGCVSTLTTTATYKAANVDLGRYLVAQVTATNAVSSVSKWTTSTNAINSLPSTTVNPAVVGAPVLGETLSATDGTWKGSPAPVITRAWYSCTSAVAAVVAAKPTQCTAIAGETGNSISVGNYLGAKFLSFAVTGTNAAGTVTKWSITSAVVPTPSPAAPAPLTYPAIWGPTIVGSTLTVDPGVWDGYPVPALTYQWYTCSAPVSNPVFAVPSTCTAVTGRTSTTYLLAASDVGKSISVKVTATSTSGTLVVVLPSMDFVYAPMALTSASSMVFTAPATSVTTFTGTKATWSGTVGQRTSSWLVCDSPKSAASGVGYYSPAGCSGQGWGATTFTPDDSSTGKYLVFVTAARPYPDNSAFSSELQEAAKYSASASSPQIQGAGRSVIAPTITGSNTAGSVLSVSAGTWTTTPAGTLSYQWYRCIGAQDGYDGCTAIDSATLASYTLTADDTGQWVTATVTTTNTYGSVTAQASNHIGSDAPVISVSTPTSTVHVGSSIRPVVVTNSTSAAPITLSFQWYDCGVIDPPGQGSPPVSDWSGCTAIDGANSDTFTPTDQQAGKSVNVLVTATSAGGQTSSLNNCYILVSDAAIDEMYPLTPPSATADGVALKTGDMLFSGEVITPIAATWNIPSDNDWWTITTCPPDPQANCTNQMLWPATTFTVPEGVRQITVTAGAYSNACGCNAQDNGTNAVTFGVQSNPFKVLGDNSVGGRLWFSWNGGQYIKSSQWALCTSKVTGLHRSLPTGCVDLPATNSTNYLPQYVLTSSELGKYVTVHVTLTDSTQSAVHDYWLPSSEVINKAPVFSASPLMSGVFAAGGTLRVFPGIWSGSPSFSYRWYECNGPTDSDTCSRIPNQNTDTFTPSNEYLGRYFKVEVIAANAYGFNTYTLGQTLKWSIAGPCSVDLHFRKTGQVGSKYSFAWDPSPSGCALDMTVGYGNRGTGMTIQPGSTSITLDMTGWTGSTLITLYSHASTEWVSPGGYGSMPITLTL